MPTEKFTRAQFEASLPVTQKCLGLIDGEYCYVVPVLKPGIPNVCEVEIYIRSSVKSDGLAASTGEDSIRVFLVDAVDRKPVASKSQRWVARTSGWRNNLLGLLREMYKLGLLLGTCPQCHKGQVRAYKAKTPHNAGRLFAACYNGGVRGCDYFKWVDEIVK